MSASIVVLKGHVLGMVIAVVVGLGGVVMVILMVKMAVLSLLRRCDRGSSPHPRDAFLKNLRDGCTHPTNALEFIQLLLIHELLMFLMEETNSYAMHCLHMKKCNVCSWKGCNLTDIAHYQELVMFMGVHEMVEITLYWTNSPRNGQLVFPYVTTQAQFVQMGRCFHAFRHPTVPKGNADKTYVREAFLGAPLYSSPGSLPR